MGTEPVVQAIGSVIESCGVGVIAAGAAWSFGRYARALAARKVNADPYLALRRDLGRSVLLGLEVLVAGDIIRTVASQPTLATLAVLGGVVLIRTFLSITIDTEVNGRWPWRDGVPPPPERPVPRPTADVGWDCADPGSDAGTYRRSSEVP